PLVPPDEPACVELVLQDVLDVAWEKAAVLPSERRPEALAHDGVADRLEGCAADAKIEHAAEEGAPSGHELDGAAAVAHDTVGAHQLLVAVADRRPRRVPAVLRLRVLRFLRAP